MNACSFLLRDEIRSVLINLRERENLNSRQNLIIFRLSCCCGLRRREISGLTLGDLNLGSRPAIRVRKDVAKGKRARLIPLWWDEGTLTDLKAWVKYREENGGNSKSWLVCTLAKGREGRQMYNGVVARRWKTAIKVLGEERIKQLSIHAGRHSFCSHALDRGHSLVDVRDAAGHANVGTTNIYLHAPGSGDFDDLFPEGDL